MSGIQSLDFQAILSTIQYFLKREPESEREQTIVLLLASIADKTGGKHLAEKTGLLSKAALLLVKEHKQ